MNHRQRAALLYALRLLPLQGSSDDARARRKALAPLTSEHIVVRGIVLVKSLVLQLRPGNPSVWVGEIKGFEQPPTDEMLEHCIEQHLKPLFRGVGISGRLTFADARTLPHPVDGLGFNPEEGYMGAIVVDASSIWAAIMAAPREALQALDGEWPPEDDQAAYSERTGTPFAEAVESLRVIHQEVAEKLDTINSYLDLLGAVEPVLKQSAGIQAIEQHVQAQAGHAVHQMMQPTNGTYKGIVSVAGYRQPEQVGAFPLARMTVVLSIPGNTGVFVWESWKAPESTDADFMLQSLACAEALRRAFPGVEIRFMSALLNLETCNCGACPSGFHVAMLLGDNE